MKLRTFKGEPNLLVRFQPPIGNIQHVRFNEKGEFTTGNERVIQRFMHRFDSVPVTEEVSTPEERTFACKQCVETFETKSELLSHYRKTHPSAPKSGT